MADWRQRVPIIALLAGSGISLLGNMMTLIAIPWFVLQTTGSAARTGLASAMWILPVVLSGVLGGPIVDRLGHRRSILIADIVSGVAIGIIPLLHSTVGLAFWQLLALVFIRGLFDIPGRTARRAMMPELAHVASMSLVRANSSFVVIRDTGTLIGPALSGALIAFIGASNVLWIDAATYFASALIVVVAIPTPESPAEREVGGGRFLADLIECLRFVRGRQLVLSLMAASAIVSFLGEPLYGVILPVYADQELESAAAYGLIIAGFGAGSLVGSLLFGAVGHRLPRREVLVGTLVTMALPFWVLTSLPSFPVTFGLVAFGGFASAPFTILFATVLQEQVPKGLRGRVFGLDTTIGTAGMPLGIALVGVLIEVAGLRAVLIIEGVAFVCLGVVMYANPALRVHTCTSRR